MKEDKVGPTCEVGPEIVATANSIIHEGLNITQKPWSETLLPDQFINAFATMINRGRQVAIQ